MHRTLPRPPKIVDLHADAILDDIEDYDQDELIDISIDRLRETLDAAIYWEYAEIRYIHGKGRGILRKLVYEELQRYRDMQAIHSFFPSSNNQDIVVVNLGI